MSLSDDYTKEQRQLICNGIAYFDRLHAIDLESSKLGSEVIYNMVSLGIEAVFTGILLKYDCILDHSNIFRLLSELGEREELPLYDKWMSTAKLMAKFQSYCSLEITEIKIPNKNELNTMFEFAFEVEKYAKMQKIAC